MEPAELWKPMIDAAREALGENWEAIRKYAEPELERLARTILEIGAQAASGEISESEARALIRVHRNTTEMVILTAKGMSLLTVEKAVNAAIRAAKAPVQAALGLTLL